MEISERCFRVNCLQNRLKCFVSIRILVIGTSLLQVLVNSSFLYLTNCWKFFLLTDCPLVCFGSIVNSNNLIISGDIGCDFKLRVFPKL